MIYAIDPGTTHSTAVMFEPWKGDRIQPAPSGPGAVRGMWRDLPNAGVLECLNRHASLAVDIVIEDCENMGQVMGYDMITTIRWSGRFWERARFHGADVHFLKRSAVKLHLCGSRRAKDPNVRMALCDRFGGEKAAKGKKANPGPLFGIASHAWSALALAITWAETGGET